MFFTSNKLIVKSAKLLRFFGRSVFQHILFPAVKVACAIEGFDDSGAVFAVYYADGAVVDAEGNFDSEVEPEYEAEYRYADAAVCDDEYSFTIVFFNQ